MTREELQDERQEQEALKSAKEIAKKKSKDKVQKIILQAVKTAVIPMLLALVKVLAVVILVCAVASLFSSILNGGGEDTTSTDEEYSSAVTEQVDIKNTQLSNDEITMFILDYNNTNSSLKTTMIDNLEYIIQWQNNYGYSAQLFITIAFEENESFATFLPKMHSYGSIWKTNGYTTIQEIAESYVGDETATLWANNIELKMQENIGSDTN